MPTPREFRRRTLRRIVADLSAVKGEWVDMKKFVGSIVVETGCKRTTVQEYLDDLEYAGIVELNDDLTAVRIRRD